MVTGHGAPLQAAPDRPALWSRQRPRRTIEHARGKRRELGQAVRGDGPGMQLQMREGPRRGRARARHSRLVMYRQQWSSLNACALNNMLPGVASSRSSDSAVHSNDSGHRQLFRCGAAGGTAGRTNNEIDCSMASTSCIPEGEQMKGLKRVNGRCSLTSSDGRAAVPAGRAVTSSLSLNCRSLLPPSQDSVLG